MQARVFSSIRTKEPSRIPSVHAVRPRTGPPVPPPSTARRRVPRETRPPAAAARAGAGGLPRRPQEPRWIHDAGVRWPPGSHTGPATKPDRRLLKRHRKATAVGVGRDPPRAPASFPAATRLPGTPRAPRDATASPQASYPAASCPQASGGRQAPLPPRSAAPREAQGAPPPPPSKPPPHPPLPALCQAPLAASRPGSATPRPGAAGQRPVPLQALLTPKAAPPTPGSGGRPDAAPPALTDRRFKPQHPPPFRKRGASQLPHTHRSAHHPSHRRSATFAGHAGSAGGDARSWRSALDWRAAAGRAGAAGAGARRRLPEGAGGCS